MYDDDVAYMYLLTFGQSLYGPSSPTPGKHYHQTKKRHTHTENYIFVFVKSSFAGILFQTKEGRGSDDNSHKFHTDISDVQFQVTFDFWRSKNSTRTHTHTHIEQ